MRIMKAATNGRSDGAIAAAAGPARAAAVPGANASAINGLAANAAVPGVKGIAHGPARKDPGSAAKNRALGGSLRRFRN